MQKCWGETAEPYRTSRKTVVVAPRIIAQAKMTIGESRVRQEGWRVVEVKGWREERRMGWWELQETKWGEGLAERGREEGMGGEMKGPGHAEGLVGCWLGNEGKSRRVKMTVNS